MAIQSKAHERKYFIDTLGPLGVPMHVIARAADCSEASIRGDVRGAGGITTLFPNRPKKPGDIYASVLKHFMRGFGTREWSKRPEQKALSEHLSFAEVEVFAQGAYASYKMLTLESLKGRSKLLQIILRIKSPEEVFAETVHTSSLEWLVAIVEDFTQSDDWPTSAEDFKWRIAEYVRTSADRSKLRSTSPEDALDRFKEIVASHESKRSQRVLNMRFGLHEGEGGLTLQEVGADMQITRERVRQIEVRSFRRLRHASSSGELHDVSGFTFESAQRVQAELVAANATIEKLMKEREKLFAFYQQIAYATHEIDLIVGKPNSFGNLFKSVYELELSVRSLNCLQNAGIEFVYQLVPFTLDQIREMKNFGRKSLNEIREVLRELGLSFGMTLSAETLLAIEKHKSRL